MASFIEYILGPSPHYICYKLVNNDWYKYDDQSIMKSTMKASYRISLAFYRSQENTEAYTGIINVEIKKST